MLAGYDDIRSRIKEEPAWYDCNGVPRYGDFHPFLSPNIYADQVALVEIGCQSCNIRLKVEFNYSNHQAFAKEIMENYDASEKIKNKELTLKAVENKHGLKSLIRQGTLHYGDPPRHACSGDTMNCLDFRVLEFWEKGEDELWKFRRNSRYEIALEDGEWTPRDKARRALLDDKI